MIDWKDPKAKISQYFTVHEATYLPSWQIYHTPSAQEQANILKTAGLMDQIRDFLDTSINVTVWIRPRAVNCPAAPGYNGRNYNSYIGGMPQSAHIQGLAVDWTASKITCADARDLLVPELARLGIRMENKSGANWVHIDLMPPNPNRYFKV